MKVKSYQAYSMAEALAAVREDLGQHALILQTRSFRRGGVLGLGRRTVVEITATPAESHDSPAPPAAAAAARRAYALSCGAPPVEACDLEIPPTASPAPAEERAAPAEPVARRFVLRPVEVAAPERPPGRAREIEPRRGPMPQSRAFEEAMQDELAAIKRMVSQVLNSQNEAPAGNAGTAAALGPALCRDMPPALFDLSARLLGQDLAEELVESIIEQAGREAPAGDESGLREAVLEHLTALIPGAEGESLKGQSSDGRPLTIALVGPTGVGKTTTLAKLAAACILTHDRRVGLVTADTYRIAAVEQLRTYAQIIGVPLNVARTPQEMRQALAALSDCQVVLIDTAGRSQNDVQRIADLKRFIAAAEPHEVHLVLSAAASERALRQEVEAFGTLGIDRIILSKIDEAAALGPIVNIVHEIGRPVSYLTTGQEVPDHIEPCRPRRLAALLLEGRFRR